MNDELICPFPDCGSAAKVREFFGSGFTVQCTNPECFVMGRVGRSAHEAVTYWLRLQVRPVSLCLSCVRCDECDLWAPDMIHCLDYEMA